MGLVHIKIWLLYCMYLVKWFKIQCNEKGTNVQVDLTSDSRQVHRSQPQSQEHTQSLCGCQPVGEHAWSAFHAGR